MRILRSVAVTAFAVLCSSAVPGAARSESQEIEALRAQIDALAEQNRQMQRSVGALQDEVRAARDDARAAAAPAPVGAGASAGAEGPLLSMGTQGSGARLQLLDVSLDVLSAFGFSTATDDELGFLQGGGHDPNQRGFTLQQVELSMMGAVDPYMTGEAHLVYFLDREGESRFEIEEAFLTSSQLPWALHEKGFQVEAGQFFTEFGLINPRHPHEWAWQDQPFVWTRFFGADAMRAPGVRVGWLSPLPWYSELHVGVQNAKGETMRSFLANEEVFQERPIGGRPFASNQVGGLGDLLYLARWVNAFDLSDTTSAQLGVSGVLGPNATGSDGRTIIAGGDVKLKWMPLESDRGWPFVTVQAEVLYRDYRADSFFGCAQAECETPEAFPADILQDWGLYAQVLYGFRRGWATGIRYEYGTGSGDSIGEFQGRADDPFRADRHRVSPLLSFRPSEFSRVRVQYNYDQLGGLSPENAHSVWAGVEFMFGAHPAHNY